MIKYKWYIASLFLLSLFACGSFAVTIWQNSEYQVVNDDCPNSLELAFGQSFSEIRDACLSNKSDHPAPALTCGQIRVLGLKEDAKKWPEGLVAYETARRHCMFTANEAPSYASNWVSARLDGDLQGEIHFEETNDGKCNAVSKVDLVVNKGKVNLQFGKNEYQGVVYNNSWISIPLKGGEEMNPDTDIVVMGPINDADVFHFQCGFGNLKLVQK